jgi:hypothetical protein
VVLGIKPRALPKQDKRCTTGRYLPALSVNFFHEAEAGGLAWVGLPTCQMGFCTLEGATEQEAESGCLRKCPCTVWPSGA